MKIFSSLLNRSESRVHGELLRIQKNNEFFVFPKMRLSDVIDKRNSYLTQREFDFYSRSHFDFVIADSAHKPIMAIEYDGPLHADKVQHERDEIKNALCQTAGLGLLRINDRYVSRLNNGMTLLRWILEVRAHTDAFAEEQDQGRIPKDEVFDPAFLMTPDLDKLEAQDFGERFPYWISRKSIESINDFLFTGMHQEPKEWLSVCGEDKKGNEYRLSFLCFGNLVLWNQTAMKKQNLDIASSQLLEELDTWELGLHLGSFLKGKKSSLTREQFLPIFRGFCGKYNAMPSHSSGNSSFSISWNMKTGWKFNP